LSSSTSEIHTPLPQPEQESTPQEGKVDAPPILAPASTPALAARSLAKEKEAQPVASEKEASDSGKQMANSEKKTPDAALPSSLHPEDITGMKPLDCYLLPFSASDSLEPANQVLSVPSGQEMKSGIWKVYAGVSFLPRLIRYDIQKTREADNKNSFSDDYLNNRRNQNSLQMNYGGELNIGLLYKGKWELLLGCGYQRMEYQERPLNPAIPVYTTVSGGGGVNPNFTVSTLVAGTQSAPIKNTFEYLSTSLNCNRLMNLGKVRLKVGAGLRTDYLLRANVLLLNSPYYYEYAEKYRGAPLNKWAFAPQFNVGVIRDLSEHFQIQVCSTLFYSTSSMFEKNYLITQKSYGTGLECILLYKFP
jgi:hypothetical protein